MRGLLVAVAAAAVGGVLAGAGCGDACRVIQTKPVALQCTTASPFTGEIHFDDPATFESFLLTDCLPDATDDDRAKIVRSVDFTKDAVFVAAGLREQPGATRCIAERKQDDVSVCEDGLRVAFADRITDDNGCQGKWTVAFALPRAELRAALQTSVGGPQPL